ncbi:RsmD family RNA methyltransferase [Candidatus Pacearchaeota archaeon]|nr:RsmD family RNA methyltransferase [Candidatus Pacearchaeota archaeon]
MKKIRAFDVFGNIAIIKFPKDFKLIDKKKFANKILKDNNSIKTVLEKVGKFSGRLRKMKTKHLAGEKTKEVLYKENGCVFRFNIDKTYFSPRLSNERKEIASKIKKGDNVLVMFAGVAPFSIIIAKSSQAEKVVSNEINKEANKYARLNVELNKLKDKVELLSGDIKKVIPKLKERFDIIVMPRPRLKDTFLEQAFKVSKKGTKIFYYDFCQEDEVNSIIDKIKQEAKKAKKKIKILKTKSAGETAPYKIRVRIDFEVL